MKKSTKNNLSQSEEILMKCHLLGKNTDISAMFGAKIKTQKVLDVFEGQDQIILTGLKLIKLGRSS